MKLIFRGPVAPLQYVPYTVQKIKHLPITTDPKEKPTPIERSIPAAAS